MQTTCTGIAYMHLHCPPCYMHHKQPSLLPTCLSHPYLHRIVHQLLVWLLAAAVTACSYRSLHCNIKRPAVYAARQVAEGQQQLPVLVALCSPAAAPPAHRSGIDTSDSHVTTCTLHAIAATPARSSVPAGATTMTPSFSFTSVCKTLASR
jgi:hypothetical protein